MIVTDKEAFSFKNSVNTGFDNFVKLCESPANESLVYLVELQKANPFIRMAERGSKRGVQIACERER